MRNIVLVTYFFPPYNHSGIQRPLKFAKWLPKFGYDPIVLTCGNMRWDAYDVDTYKSEVLNKIEVFKFNAPRFKGIGSPLFSRHFMDKWILKLETLFFEDRLDWAIGVRQKSLELVRDREVKLVFTTGPPQSVHYIGLYLKRKLGIPWVMDFRDPMVQRAPAQGGGKIKHFIQELRKRTLFLMYERLWVKKANSVVTATKSMTANFQFQHPDFAKKITTITNGFDPEDFDGLKGTRRDKSRFTLVYTGRLTEPRSPRDFFEGLRKALTINSKLRDQLEVLFIGPYNKKNIAMLSAPDLRGVVKYLGIMDHIDCISYQLGSDANLLIVAPADSFCIPGKLFEYLRAGQPILALTPEGIVKKVIDDNRLGVTVDPLNHEGIASHIIALYKLWKNGNLGSIKPSEAFLKQYERKTLTHKLAGIFDQCLDH